MVKSNSIGEAVITIILLLPVILPVLLVFGVYRLIRFSVLKRNKLYLANIEEMSPYEFENYISTLFQKMGYKTRTTKASRDFGVDVIARKEEDIVAVQVKKYKDCPVGNKEIQMLLGAMQMRKIRANRSIIITTSRFTKNALEQADGCPIELWDGKKLNKVIEKYVN